MQSIRVSDWLIEECIFSCVESINSVSEGSGRQRNCKYYGGANVMKLNQLKNKNGPLLSKEYIEMTTIKSMYRGVKLIDREQPNYLQKLVENIEDDLTKPQ